MTEEQIKLLRDMMGYMRDQHGTLDTYVGDAAVIRAYAECQIALQLNRIAEVLEEMYKGQKGTNL